MKATYFMQTGGPEVLQYGELPDPEPGAGEIVVDIQAASVNGVDWKIRSGRYKEITRFPYVLGRDFSGVVAALGEGVEGLPVGTPVFGVCETTDDGAYAEKIAINATNVARKPDSVSHVEAAALALAGLTAIVSIEHTLNIQSGEHVLIQGGAGGVGSFAIQLARHLGAKVTTTASAANHDYLLSLGAQQAIDYRTQDFTRCVSACDAVLDTIGGEVAERSFRVLRSGGRAAFIASGPKAPTPARSDVQALRPQVNRDSAYLERIMALLESRAIQVPEITTFALEDAAKAHCVSESRHLRGKLVLEVKR
ncbi:NADP-dependent oxidoreductase [Billgrantia pellis]|uniref:NADP-dependent oxidoreductase n=1 Tax=Billgrantia pellis TaxID=2606936 RepID=A0A7V7FZV6_9GAMM|nr:NADP-dependent oxidoreductase [Halomonas pellis]KAA0010047.1 NADP-dependent oxidoreductase [Halomonas pellis]